MVPFKTSCRFIKIVGEGVAETERGYKGMQEAVPASDHTPLHLNQNTHETLSLHNVRSLVVTADKGVHLIGDGRVRCLRLEEEAFANSTEELEHEDDDLVQTGRLESGEESRDPG